MQQIKSLPNIIAKFLLKRIILVEGNFRNHDHILFITEQHEIVPLKQSSFYH